jgi:eukaryotic-like serine/threonine-protein kinase
MKNRDDIIADLLLRWEESYEHGNDITASELCKDHPELTDDLQSKIDDLKKMSWMTDGENGQNENDSDELLNKTLGGRYRLESLIAQGGFGRVYKAFDPELERHVAVKVPSRSGEFNGQVDSLVEEARRVAKLRHPGIVSVHDVGKDDGSYFIVSELINGSSLAEIIATKRPSTRYCVLLVAEIAENLQVAHEAGFIHRDIKPANILIDENGKPLITDFGIASTHDDKTASTKGTLPYMAPEQVANEPQLIDRRADIYSLGVILFELLTGGSPYSARTPGTLREQILFRQPKPFETNSVSQQVQDVCLKCLSKHPADRFETATELALALRQSSTIKEASKFSRLSKWLVVLAGVAVVATLSFAAGSRFGTQKSNPAQTNSTSVPFVANSVMNFDGNTRIVTKLKSFYPCTLECWCRIEEYDSKVSPQAIIGSDLPTKHGLSMGISTHVPFAETVDQTFFAPKSVQVKSWIHLAVVFSESETRIYLDGEQQLIGPPTKPHGDVVFVVGNIGLDNPLCYFHGQVRSIRISRGEEYTADFTPDEDLMAKEATELLYTSESIAGDSAKDLSGKGNDGQVERKEI